MVAGSQDPTASAPARRSRRERSDDINRTDLDRLATHGCALCAKGEQAHDAHDPVYFHARCHPNARLWARYGGGVLTLVCGDCERVVANIDVAAGGATR